MLVLRQDNDPEKFPKPTKTSCSLHARLYRLRLQILIRLFMSPSEGLCKMY